MIFWRYGNNLSKASQVLGDFSLSQRARNSYGPAVIFTSLKRSRSFLYGAPGSQARYAPLGELLEMFEVAGDKPAIEREVHGRGDLCKSELLIEVLGIAGRWVGI